MTARNHSLDALRALAILMVLGTHVVPPDLVKGTERAITELGARGVDLFFVLSGYLVGGIALREFIDTGTLDVKKFWYRRWLRTLPAYYVTLFLYLLKQAAPHRSAGLGEPTTYLVFLQTYFIGELTDFAHSWSLCVEEHFYLVLPLAIWCLGRLGTRTPIVVLLAGGGVLMLSRTVAILQGVSIDQRVSHWRTDALLVGVGLAALELSYPAVRSWMSSRISGVTTTAAVAIVMACVAQVMGFAHWQPAFAVAFGLAVATAVARPPWLESLGRAPGIAWIARVSYSLYLLHPLVMGGLDFLYFRPRYHQPLIWMIYAVLSVTLSCFAAWLQYRFVEVPFLRWRDRSRRNETAMPTPAE